MSTTSRRALAAFESQLWVEDAEREERENDGIRFLRNNKQINKDSWSGNGTPSYRKRRRPLGVLIFRCSKVVPQPRRMDLNVDKMEERGLPKIPLQKTPAGSFPAAFESQDESLAMSHACVDDRRSAAVDGHVTGHGSHPLDESPV